MKSLLGAALVFAGLSANATVDNISEVSLVGQKNCIVFYAEQAHTNAAEIVVACNGNLLMQIQAPSRKALTPEAVKAIKTGYRQVFTEKCLEAGMNKQQTIESDEFWGIFCN